MDRPNIMYVHAHDTGRYVEPYGYAIPTPRLRRLAEQGVLFRRAFSAAPTCSPSRAALLTGVYPHENGMLGLSHRGFELVDHDRHLAHVLGRNGYHTALVGVQHVARDPFAIGYAHVPPVATRRAADVGAAATRLLADEGLPEPFFLDVGFFENHRPFPDPGPGAANEHIQPPVPIPDTPKTRADMAAYRMSAASLDTGLGAVLDALDSSGFADRTLVICTTDHGLPFPTMKSNLTDHGIGVMLILRGPGELGGGRTVDAMVSQLDLYPTICALARVTPRPEPRGRSLLPLLRGEVAGLHDELYAEATYHAAYEPQRCVRAERWKYIRRFDHRDRRVVVNYDPGPSRDLFEAYGWAEQRYPAELLFDLFFDPSETHDRAGDPAAASVLTLLRERLDCWLEETDDPIRHGPMPAPTGARIEPAD